MNLPGILKWGIVRHSSISCVLPFAANASESDRGVSSVARFCDFIDFQPR